MPGAYVREERLVEKFCALLREVTFDESMMVWVGEAFRESHQDEKQFHDEAIARASGAIRQTPGPHRIRQTVQTHQAATESYFDEGLRLLELARRAHILFRQQQANERRRLLDFVVSNCTWKQGELLAAYRQPFDLLAIAGKGQREQSPPGESSRPLFKKWLPELDSNQQPPG
jgi:site-specific DNA recombinase